MSSDVLLGELIREPTVAVLARTQRWTAPPVLSAERLQVAQGLRNDPESTVSKVARTLGVHRSTLHKALHGAVANRMKGEAGRGLVWAG
jgi:ActR/RegA family two-component response regulator